MQLTPQLRIDDLALTHTPTNTVILGDTHIGEEEALNAQGVFVPRFAFKDLYQRTNTILEATSPDRIILNGDVKHNFDRISHDEWDNVHVYIELLASYGEVTIVRGNHDVLLEPVLDRIDHRVEDYVELSGVLVCHGHQTVDDEAYEDAETVILGHEHPAVTLQAGERSEHYKAFLKLRHDEKTYILMPSMNQLREGSDTLKEQLLSPYLDDADILDAEAFLVGENNEAHAFGTLGDLRRTTA